MNIFNTADRCNRKHLFLTLFAASFMMLAYHANGGDGTIDAGSPHKVNLSVAFLYDETDPDDWKPLFEKASELLYDATEKQMQFGTIAVYNNCPSKQDQADIHIVNDNSGARAHPGGLGSASRHLWISQTHKSTSGAAIGQFGVVHELGHYAFRLYDEYRGKTLASADAPVGTPNANPAETFFCANPNGAGTASIMDGGTTVSPANTRTEFCTDPDDGFATSHESGYINGSDYFINDQQDRNGESSWETVVAYSSSQYGLTVNAPTSEPQSDTAGHQAINWELKSCDTRAVISIDRSGSMAGQSIDLARQAGKLFVDLADVGQDIGVTSFASDATVNFALQEVISDATKQSARDVIDTLSATGLTNIGGGLQVSLNQITAVAADRSDNEVIVLLSDGQHNTGTAPSSVLPSIIAENVTVHTVGLGAGADLALLQDVANSTGGIFRFASSAADLGSIFTQLSAETRGEGLIDREDGSLAAGEMTSRSVFVDTFSSEVTFILNFSAGQLELVLHTPSGAQIDAAQAATDPNVHYTAGSHYQIFRITGPESGTWSLAIKNSGAGAQAFTATTLGRSSGVAFKPFADRSRYVYPEPIVVSALVEATHAVTGATVAGVVARPDGSTLPFELFDDGSAAHGDESADDGIYSNRLTTFAGDGVYTFDLQAVNQNGFAMLADVFEEDPNGQPIPIAPFVRQGSLSIVVANAPNHIPATLEVGPEVINLKSKGQFITTYIELSDGFDVADIDISSVKISEVDGQAVTPIVAQAQPTAIGDVDNDGRSDLMVKFDRAAVQAVVVPGLRELSVEGTVAGQLFKGLQAVRVIDPGSNPQ